MYISEVGFPPCGASHVHRIWPPVWTGFHVSQSVFNTRPLALSCFPCTRTETSGSQLLKIWPPVWTGFHVSQSVCITGPPALPGFPSTRTEAFGIDRLLCLGRFLHWASHVTELPSCTECGLRHGPASIHPRVNVLPGLPLSPAFPSTQASGPSPPWGYT